MRELCVCMCVCLYMCILPMLIRTEGVGLRLENRREKGKNKKQRTKMHFVSDYGLKLYVWGGAGRSINSGD